jgi:hypothetical protein
MFRNLVANPYPDAQLHELAANTMSAPRNRAREGVTVTGPEEVADPRFERRGMPWAEDDYLEFVGFIRDGLTDDELVVRLGRTLGALQIRARVMGIGRAKRAAALDSLRAASRTILHTTGGPRSSRPLRKPGTTSGPALTRRSWREAGSPAPAARSLTSTSDTKQSSRTRLRA